MPEEEGKAMGEGDARDLFEIQGGSLFCKLCGACLGEKSIAKEDEQSLPSEISVHFSVVHGRDVTAEFEL